MNIYLHLSYPPITKFLLISIKEDWTTDKANPKVNHTVAFGDWEMNSLIQI